MVRVSKADKQSTTPAPVDNVVVVVDKKPRVSKKPVEVTASSSNSTSTSNVVSTVETTPVAPVEVVDSSVSTRINEFSAKLQQMASLFASIKGDFKNLEKSVSRELKNAQKSSSRRSKSSGNRQPSGFVKPTKISDELAKFLGKASGVEMARTAVSKEINAYIREKGLQDASNGRKINADASLSKLLNLKKEDELTYFNLQRYMKHHFIKAPVVVPEVVAPIA
jgi:chromatin remodeling complex protein RSC6